MNTHLNIFKFFNNNDIQFYEDNLSRAFALCLKNDSVFLDHILRNVLGDGKGVSGRRDLYEQNFSIDDPAENLLIDLQVNANTLSGFKTVVAVACSGTEVGGFNETESRKTEEPITDVLIKLNDTCVVFEFKRTNEDCVAQLKGQAEAIVVACEGDAEIIYVDLCWSKIVKIVLRVLSLQKHLGHQNPFILDFAQFLEFKHAEWFPVRCLSSILFPKGGDDPNNQHLEKRLRQIVLAAAGDDDNVVETGGRYAMKIPFGWANEVNIGHHADEEGEFLLLQVWAGDTKGQGRSLFKPDRSFCWPKRIIEHTLQVEPYLKFANSYGKGLCSVFCDSTAQSQETHNHEFYIKHTGRVKREEWEDFYDVLDPVIPGWREKKNCAGLSFQRCFEEASGITEFNVSIGFLLTVKMDYAKAKKLDLDLESSTLHEKIQQVISGIRECVDGGK